ncbi:hypothetical protein MsAg5_00070 [Methanosarcinaceae archaeon Ag5]|uniref:DUF447 family protein n=1 Tax=Methanolapillus africanus TaxID=3028297 RepID=A0AAE4MHY2_9EURY|nr:hypothetical protein [Methanosarcinaceae archaeon Ag5]
MKETAENLRLMREFGIDEGISEIILSSRNDPEKDQTEPESNCLFNAAPIGIIWKNDKMFLRLFPGTQTYENLMREEYFSANITTDSVLYANATFYDLDADEFSTLNFSGTIVPVLKNADRYVVFRCVNRLQTSETLIIDIEPIGFKVQTKKSGFLVNRGFSSIIEICVHLTRYEQTKDPKYIELIKHHWSLAQRCGRKRDKEALSILKKRLAGFEDEI